MSLSLLTLIKTLKFMSNSMCTDAAIGSLIRTYIKQQEKEVAQANLKALKLKASTDVPWE